MAGKRYDVFVSHNSVDQQAAEALASALREAGLDPFLAAWSLVPGDPWQEGLEAGLEQSCTCAVLVGPKGLGPWQTEEMRLALDQRVREQGYRVVPVLLPGSVEPGVDPLKGFLGRFHAADLRRGLDDPEGFSALLAGLVGERPAPGEEILVPPPRTQAELRRIEQAFQGLEAAEWALGKQEAEATRTKLRAEQAKLEGAPRVRVQGVGLPGPKRLGADRHAASIRAYYQALGRECARLPLGVIDKHFTQTAGEESIPLPDVYVDLDVVRPSAELASEKGGGQATDWALRLARGEGSRMAVLEAVASSEHRRAVVLGDPGSGKTTFAHYLAYLLATDHPAVPSPLQGLLPVRLVLRDVGAQHVPPDTQPGTASMLWGALKADVAGRLGQPSEAIFEALRSRLLEQGGFFLLDGLDEVPASHRRRQTLLEAVGELAAEVGERSRVLVTARPYAYAEPGCRLRGFSTLALAPFDEDQVRRFVSRWYQAVRESLHWSPEAAEERGRALAGAVLEVPYLADLASRPLLLTLMATLHSSGGRLPDDRADLYEEIVQLLLGRWQRFRTVTGPAGEEVIEPGISEALQVGEEKIRARLEELAFRVHERQRAEAERREESADIAESELLAAVRPLLESVGPDKLLAYLKHRAGLLVERREGIYAFPHRSFQEYLAATYLAGRPDAVLALRRRVCEDPAWWREVFLLAVGKARQGRLPDAVSLVQPLLTVATDDEALRWRLAALAGEALVDLRLLERAGEDLADYEEMILAEVRRRLVALVQGGHLPPRERVAAGDTLGALRDPRPGVEVVEVGGRKVPDLEWIEIPPGSFVMGSEEGEEGAYDDERPAHELTLPGFYLSRYPVTNAQYRVFVEAGGYENQSYWTEEGWEWRQGAEADLSGLEEEWRERYAEWLAGRPKEKRHQPFFWAQPPWNLPSRPVVGITWYEALAFCSWLDGELRRLPWWTEQAEALEGWKVRLPSEAEWEAAARGCDRRRWPWGNTLEEDRANLEETGLTTTSPVGIFPRGRNPFGLDDLSGNVWEWTLSRWGRTARQPDYRYPYDRKDGREDLAGSDRRVVRGGSWGHAGGLGRCGFRDWLIPSSFDVRAGFRCGVFPG